MGQFKQMQIQFDDDYFNQQGESYTEEQEETTEYDSSLEDTHNYNESRDGEVTKPSRSCKHKIKCIMGRKHIATYCEKCGKVFDVKKK